MATTLQTSVLLLKRVLSVSTVLEVASQPSTCANSVEAQGFERCGTRFLSEDARREESLACLLDSFCDFRDVVVPQY